MYHIKAIGKLKYFHIIKIDSLGVNFMQLYKGFYPGRTDNQKAPAFNSGEPPLSLDLVKAQNPMSIVGVLASNVLMVDCDTAADSLAMDKALAKLGLSVPTMTTTRGKHYYFDNSGVSNKSVTGARLACGIKADIKNGATTAFDCIVMDNTPRLWDNYDKPLTPLPKWLTPLGNKLPTYSGMTEGSRNETLMTELGTLKRCGFSYEEAKVALSVLNACVFADPVPLSEFNHVTRQALYDNAYVKQNKGKNTNFTEQADSLDSEPVASDDGKKKRFDHEGIALAIIENMKIINVDGMLMAYSNGVYLPVDREEIERIICRMVPDTTIRQRAEVYSSMRLLCTKRNYNDSFDYLDYFAFENGIFKLDLEWGALHKVEEDPQRLIFNRIPYPYNPLAKNALLESFFNDITCGRPEIRLQLNELLGHCLMRRNSIRGIFMLLGKTSNGKSTFLDMLSHMLGSDNASYLKLHELPERFNKWQIGYKLANIGDDISNDYLPDNNVIKSISTSDAITVERKGKDPYKINPYCTLIFSANDLPRLKDAGNAMLNRITVIPFDANFSQVSGKFDPNLINKLIAPEVMEALVKSAVDGLINIRLNNGLTLTNQKVNIRVQYAEINNPTLMFIRHKYWDDATLFSHNYGCNELSTIIDKPTNEVYNEYKEWCSEEGIKALGKTKFTHSLLDCINGIGIKQTTAYGVRAYRFINTNPASVCLNIPSAVM